MARRLEVRVTIVWQGLLPVVDKLWFEEVDD